MQTAIPTIFDLCQPRSDVLAGKVADADFAADLASVIVGKASREYLEPALFFANTYPTRGLRNLLANVCRRLSGVGGEAAAIFRLDTSYGRWQDAWPDRAGSRRTGHERRRGRSRIR